MRLARPGRTEPESLTGTASAMSMLILGMALIGMVYGPLGTLLSELFPTAVRYSGTSLAFNIAGIFGASLAPYAATHLATTYGCNMWATTCRFQAF